MLLQNLPVWIHQLRFLSNLDQTVKRAMCRRLGGGFNRSLFGFYDLFHFGFSLGSFLIQNTKMILKARLLGVATFGACCFGRPKSRMSRGKLPSSWLGFTESKDGP